MPGLFEDLVLGHVIGLALQQFFEEIKRAIKTQKTQKFDVVLTNLQNTVNLVKPKIDEISKMDKEHDHYPKQEIVVFLEQLERGEELLATCADIPRWNKCKRRKYAKRLVDMDSSLRKLLEVQFQAEHVLYIKKMQSEMAAINKKLDRVNIQIPVGVSGGGESSNAAAADQSSDDQTARRRSRFELRFRRKKENGETDINLCSNAAAADQSSDDQTARRRSRFELHFRRKKENGETDIKLGF